MKHLIFAVALTFFATQAGAGVVGTWSCGTDCTATLDGEGNMKITGSGEMRSFHPRCTPGCTSDSPWLEYKNQIKSVDIQGVSNVGDGAFYHFPIEKLTLGNTVTDINWDAFEGHHIRILELPDSVTTIGPQAFRSGYLQTLITPDTLTNFGDSFIGYASEMQTKTITVICRGDSIKCEAINNKLTGIGYNLSFSLADDTNCSSAKYYWNGIICKNRPESGNIECIDGYAANFGNCYRVRYSIPEADEATSNDTENMIEWIFE